MGLEWVSVACLGSMLLIVLWSINTQFRRLNKRLDVMDKRLDNSFALWLKRIDKIEKILNDPLGEPKD